MSANLSISWLLGSGLEPVSRISYMSIICLLEYDQNKMLADIKQFPNTLITANWRVVANLLIVSRM